MTYLLALPIGVLVGTILGTLGGGGAIIVVPAMVYLLGQDPHAAITSSLIIVTISASSGLYAHIKASRVRVGTGVAFSAAGLAGSYVGSQLSGMVAESTLLLCYAVLMLLIATVMTFRQYVYARADLSSSSDGKTGHSLTARGIRPLALIAVTATGIGLLTGFFGVGGGIIVVPVLVILLGLEMQIAIGTSLVVIILNSVAALLARFSGPVLPNWSLLAVLTASAVGGALLGTRIVDRINARQLTGAFIVLICIVGVYTGVSSLFSIV